MKLPRCVGDAQGNDAHTHAHIHTHARARRYTHTHTHKHTHRHYTRPHSCLVRLIPLPAPCPANLRDAEMLIREALGLFTAAEGGGGGPNSLACLQVRVVWLCWRGCMGAVLGAPAQ